jgi:hypothetical protein
MQRAMEANDTVGVLEMACLLLEELGDPNHGVKGQVRILLLKNLVAGLNSWFVRFCFHVDVVH